MTESLSQYKFHFQKLGLEGVIKQTGAGPGKLILHLILTKTHCYSKSQSLLECQLFSITDSFIFNTNIFLLFFILFFNLIFFLLYFIYFLFHFIIFYHFYFLFFIILFFIFLNLILFIYF